MQLRAFSGGLNDAPVGANADDDFMWVYDARLKSATSILRSPFTTLLKTALLLAKFLAEPRNLAMRPSFFASPAVKYIE